MIGRALLVLAAASASAGSVGIDRLHVCSKRFREASCGSSDVDVQKLIDASAAYCDVLAQFGSFVGPSVANVRGCIDKVGASEAGKRGSPCGTARSGRGGRLKRRSHL